MSCLAKQFQGLLIVHISICYCYFKTERSKMSEFPAKSSWYSVTYMYVFNSCRDYRQDLRRTKTVTWNHCVCSCTNIQTTSVFPEETPHLRHQNLSVKNYPILYIMRFTQTQLVFSLPLCNNFSKLNNYFLLDRLKFFILIVTFEYVRQGVL
jgi:hypothetical protein